MKPFFMLFFCLICIQLFAQRLYVHDIANGNYRSFDIGDEIEVVMLNLAVTNKGIITGFIKDGFILNDTGFIEMKNIQSLIYRTPKFGVGRILLISLGGVMTLTGSVYSIVGLILTSEEPAAIVILGLGLAIGGGGYLIINSELKKSKNNVHQIIVDNVQYRTFVE